MGRSAFLPDASILSGLLARVRVPLPDKPWNGSSVRSVSRAPLGEPHPEVASTTAMAPLAVSAPAVASTVAHEPLQDLLARLSPLPTLDARFESLVAWLKRETRARAVFVADAEGLSMVRSETGDGYLVAAGEISLVLDNLKTLLPDLDQGSTLLRLKKEGNVELIWCRTNLGRFTVGLVLEEPLEQKFLSIIKAALAMVTADRMGR